MEAACCGCLLVGSCLFSVHRIPRLCDPWAVHLAGIVPTIPLGAFADSTRTDGGIRVLADGHHFLGSVSAAPFGSGLPRLLLAVEWRFGRHLLQNAMESCLGQLVSLFFLFRVDRTALFLERPTRCDGGLARRHLWRF